MPLKIIPPRNSKTKNLYIRGTHLGIRVDESSRTDRRSVARKVLKRIEQEIERGEYGQQPERNSTDAPTFVSAAVTYMNAGKSPRHVASLIKHFGETPIDQIDQAAIDDAAMKLYPNVTNATRNSYVYTPVSAILHHAGREIVIKRPPGAKGRVITDFLTPPDAFGIITAAESIDAELAALLTFLLFTGPRIGGALNLQREDVDIARARAWARPQKGQMPMEVGLCIDLCERLASHLGSHDRRRVFRWHDGGHLRFLLLRAKLAYLGLPCPKRRTKGWRPPPNRLEWVTFHIFRHTWATWMRKYGGATTDDLTDSGNWSDPRSARRYVHAAAEGVWDKTALLPMPSKMPARGEKTGT